MSAVQGFKEFIHERLSAAAVEIFAVCEQIIVHYEDEIERQSRLLDINREPHLNSQGAEILHVCKEEQPFNKETPEPPQFTVELEELFNCCMEQQPEPNQQSVTCMETLADEESDHSETGADSEELLPHNSVTDSTIDQLPAATHEKLPALKQIVLYQVEGGNCPRRLLDILREPQIKLHKIDCPQHICKNKQLDNPKRTSNPCQKEPEQPKSEDEQEEPESPPSQEEQEEAGTILKGYQLKRKQETLTRAESEHSELEADGVDSLSESQDQNQDQNEDSGSSSGAGLSPKKNRHKTKKGKEHFTCEICEETFNYIYQLKKHLKVHAGEKQPCSSKCGKVFESQHWKSNIIYHKDKKSYSCKTCGKSTKYRANMLRHIRTHTGEKPYACSVCSWKFADRCTLLRHTRTHKGEKPYSCVTCGKAFTHHTSLAQHTKIHTGEKPFSCTLCNQSFSRQNSLSRHMIKHTGEKPYLCETCGKTFLTQSHLVVHTRRHTGERPFSCPHCEQTFTSQTSLSRHMKHDTGDKDITCEICGKIFLSRSCFLVHRRTHVGEMPYNCETCGKRFSTRYNYMSHLKIHTGEKLFFCVICGKKFAHRASLTYHRRMHTEEMLNFECDHSFLEQESLSGDGTE